MCESKAWAPSTRSSSRCRDQGVALSPLRGERVAVGRVRGGSRETSSPAQRRQNENLRAVTDLGAESTGVPNALAIHKDIDVGAQLTEFRDDAIAQRRTLTPKPRQRVRTDPVASSMRTSPRLTASSRNGPGITNVTAIRSPPFSPRRSPVVHQQASSNSRRHPANRTAFRCAFQSKRPLD